MFSITLFLIDKSFLSDLHSVRQTENLFPSIFISCYPCNDAVAKRLHLYCIAISALPSVAIQNRYYYLNATLSEEYLNKVGGRALPGILSIIIIT